MEAIGKFPIYEADQVLSAEHLNQSLNYLENHDRLSRRLLHGTGVVCGLQFTFEGGILTISKGVGISSAGYLLFTEDEMVFTQVRKYTPPYPPKYHPFYDGANQPYPLWEAVSESEAEGENLQPLADFNVADKVLLLYLEAKDKDLKECVGDDCDNNGTVREFMLRAILIKTTDLVKIFNKDGNTVEDIASTVFSRHLMQEILPPRFDVTPANIKTVAHINQAYSALCDELMPSLKIGLLQVETLYADALGIGKKMAAVLEKIKSELGAIKNQELGLQYYFDHLCDIAAAYNEFVEVATNWEVVCMPDPDDFPMHLALGEFQQIGNYSEKIFRNYFKHAATSPEAHEQRKHVYFLYQRLLKIAANFELRQQRDTKIIPSNFGMELSKKAVPYYYLPENEADKSWLKQWSFYKTQRSAWNRVGHFYNNPESQLQREIEGNNLFRVEGYLGTNYSSALANIQRDIQNYRIPIKTVALSTGSVPFDLNLLEECHISDIEENFNDAKNSLYCQMQEVSCFFGSIPYPVASNQRLAEEHKANAVAAAGSAMASINISAKKVNTGYTRLMLATNTRKTNFTKGQFIAGRCQVKANTTGRAYLDAVAEGTLGNVSLLDVYLPYLNLSGRSSQMKLQFLTYVFSVIVIDEIEELAGILHQSTLSSLDFNALRVFANEFTAFVDLYIQEINEVEADSEADVHPIIHDIKHHLLHLRGFCNLKALFSIYKSYRMRIAESLNKFRFSNFIAEHPGIDHKAGAPRGGTFILVYHTNEKQRETARPSRETNYTNVRTSAELYKRVVDNNPSVIMTASATKRAPQKVSLQEANQWMERNLAEYGAMTNQHISPELLSNFRAFLNLERTDEEPKTALAEGTVVADFYLPYICCSGCGGIEITLKEEKEPLNLSLEKSRFCAGEEGQFEFTASPAGGDVTGPGVSKKDRKFFFEPSSEDVKPGNATFTYTVDGRSVQLSVTILAAPEAAFSVSIDSTPNGSFVRFVNNSKNATSYLWDFGNGQTSDSKTPEVQAYKPSQTTAVVSLKASNGICEDEDVQTFTLRTDQYAIGLNRRSNKVCSDESPISVIITKNGKAETPPFDGVLSGKGVVVKSKNYLFNPSQADIGINELKYTVEDETVATISVEVVASFDVNFQVSANWTEFGVSAHFTKIKPAGKTAYSWIFDNSKPTQISTRSSNKDFFHTYSAEEVKGKDKISVVLTVPDGVCAPSKEVSFNVPQRGANNNKPNRFSIKEVGTSVKTLSSSATIKTNFVNPVSSARALSSKTTSAATLMTGLNMAIAKKAEQKKLLAGTYNAALAKQFTAVLDGIAKTYSKQKTKLNATQKSKLAAQYGAVAKTMINIIGALTDDLTTRETMMKSFVKFGEQVVAMKNILGAKVVNEIKSRLSALAGLNKPKVAAEASKILAQLS